MTILEMIARNRRLYPNDIALIELRPSQGLRKEVTWKEFDERVNRVANALIERGVRKGDKVIHWMMNSINWLEAYFGLIRTGAWAVPLNFRFTSQDFKYCADIAEGKVMILSEQFIDRVQTVRSQLSTIKNYTVAGPITPEGMENFEQMVSKSSSNPVEVDLNDDDECGLYFTSGTTGAPKAILLTHKNMECAAITENRHHYQTHDDNFIVIPPLYHTGAKMHWFGNMIVGARAVLLAEFTPQNLFDTIHKERGTIVWLLVPWVQDIIVALDKGELKKEDYDLSCWRLMHTGAQPIPPSLIRHWNEYFPDMQYASSYGLSEGTGPGCLHLNIEDSHNLEATGKAGFNWETRIVNDKGEDVPRGQVGELLVKGNGVMKEYYKNPEKTAETLKDGWLCTGDMAKQDDERFIYIVDRKKDLVITGGENIFPLEVEEVLRRHEKIYDAGVIGIPDERLGEIAVAVIDPKTGETLTEEEVNQFCEQNLPRYKRPRRIIFDRVPRNPTGKIEKPKLREKYAQLRG